MRILIVGGGIGGLTLAALLKQFGQQTTVIEKAHDFEHAGYMLSLYPTGNRVLYGLGLHEQFMAHSQALEAYHLHNGQGKLINPYSFMPLIKKYGPMQTILRGTLLNLLQQAIEPGSLKMNTSLNAIKPHQDKVEVELSDGSQNVYDLVIGADGIHSQVRDMVFPSSEIQHFDTGWGGWLWFAEDPNYPHERVSEFWGTGMMLGIYPIQNRLGVIAAMPNENACLDDHNKGRKQCLQNICQYLAAGLPRNVKDSISENDQQMFYWRLRDVRCKHWAKGRVVLLGDSSTAFLPTAGLGASMAMESAAALADELSRTNERLVDNAIRYYIGRRQKRVEAAQSTSRTLGKQMFQRNNFMANFRNSLMRYYGQKQLIKSTEKILNQPV
jgi:2-polyprenyl-6-methoxyphenol hydroxylase-like FAD-dependent oxidoreductase